MRRIFALQSDKSFPVLDLKLSDLLRLLPKGVSLDSVVQFSYQNPPMTAWWKSLETVFVGDNIGKSTIPDLSLWADATLILSPKAYLRLGGPLRSSGEFLPIKIGHKKFYIFICFVIAEPEFGDFQPGEILEGPEGLVFKKTAKDLLVFKCHLNNYARLCCTHRFKQLLELSGLNGILLE